MINFRSEIHCTLLKYYFTNENAKHYVRELSHMFSLDVSPLSRELKILANAGVFTVSANGREKYFTINKNYPLYGELKKITNYLVAKKTTIPK